MPQVMAVSELDLQTKPDRPCCIVLSTIGILNDTSDRRVLLCVSVLRGVRLRSEELCG